MLSILVTSIALIGWQPQPVYPVVLYGRHSATKEMRKIWGESDAPLQDASEKKTLTAAEVIKGLTAKGYRVINTGSLLVGIDENLEFLLDSKRLTLLAEAVKESDEHNVFHVQPGKNGASDQILKEVCAPTMTAPSKLEFDIQVKPVFTVRQASAPASNYVTVFLPDDPKGSSAIKDHPFVQNIAPERKRQSTDGVYPQRAKSMSVDWSQPVDARASLPIAHKVLETTLIEATESARKAREVLDKVVLDRYKNEIGERVPNKTSKLSELSPWMREQVLANFRDNYKALGYGSEDEASRSALAGDSFSVKLKYSYDFFVHSASGSDYTMTIIVDSR